ncbi:MAG: hypothetical protein ROO76_20175 [Terriglobia bacterium]|nr:hypothetical protein [Terriglobia bacterium]
MNRLLTALIAYAAVATLAWFTLSAEKIAFFGGNIQLSPRDFVVTLMAAFAALTLLHHWKEQARAKLEQEDDRE